MTRALITAFFVLAAFAVSGQRPQHGAWLTLNMPVSFSVKKEWHNDAGYRTLGESVSAQQFFYRTGFRYRFSKDLNAAGGVAFFFTRTSFDKGNNEFGREFRTWQEINAEVKMLRKLHGAARIRTEQRFFDKTTAREPYKTFRLRLRAQLRQDIGSRISLQLMEEFMSRVFDKRPGFDQNRILLSGTYQWGRSLQLQPGYMWLHWPESNQRILMLTIQKNILYQKKRSHSKQYL